MINSLISNHVKNSTSCNNINIVRSSNWSVTLPSFLSSPHIWRDTIDHSCHMQSRSVLSWVAYHQWAYLSSCGCSDASDVFICWISLSSSSLLCRSSSSLLCCSSSSLLCCSSSSLLRCSSSSSLPCYSSSLLCCSSSSLLRCSSSSVWCCASSALDDGSSNWNQVECKIYNIHSYIIWLAVSN